ncbi:MAG: hypothetical protein DRI84_06685 [Bacteroidetes bacterium]|nr:MAG: hypothetical protein DRI84_06685 [Bacteroidota bacterium]
MHKEVAYLFPAFALKYTGKEYDLISKKHNFDIDGRIAESAQLLELSIDSFDIHENNFLKSELENQILSYIFSCSFSDILYKESKRADMVSGFSMGLYSALYHAKSIDFNTGLYLIHDMYEAVKGVLKEEKYAMLSVVGFNRDDLEDYIIGSDSVEVVIQNGDYSFVVAGIENQVLPLMDKFLDEGAVHLSLFNLSSPYHAKFLLNHLTLFDSITRKYHFSDASLPLVSMIDQREIQEADELRLEVVKNVSQPMNYYRSITKMNDNGVKQFVEVGADTSLLKSSKFIDGDFKFQAIARGKYI